jgi:hypothetical protein
MGKLLGWEGPDVIAPGKLEITGAATVPLQELQADQPLAKISCNSALYCLPTSC